MTALELYGKLEGDPKFAALSYAEQIEVRKALADQILPAMPGFAEKDQGFQAEAIRQMVVRPPVLQDHEADTQLRATVAQIDAGSESAAKFLSNVAFEQAGIQAGWAANINRAVREGLKRLGAKLPYDPPKALLIGSDANKVAQYVATRGQTDPKFAPMARAQKVGTVLSSLSSTVPMMIAVPNIVGNAVGRTLGARLAGTAPTVFKTFLARTVVPQAAETLTASLLQVANRNVTAMLARNGNEAKTASEILTTMGQGALLDFTLGMAGREILPAIFLFGKRTFGRGAQLEKLNDALRRGDINEAIKLAPTVRNVPPELMKSLPELVQDTGAMKNRLTDIGMNLTDLDTRPLDRTIWSAGMMHGVVVAEKPNGFKLWKIDPESGNLSNALFKTHDELIDELSALAVKQMEALPAEQRAIFMADYDWILRYGKTVDATNAALDARATGTGARVARGFVTPSNRSFVSAEEADRILGSVASPEMPDAVALKVRVPVDEGAVTRILAQKSMLPQNGIRQFAQDAGGNAIVIVRNPATPEAIAEASTAAELALAKGSTEAKDVLVSRYLLGMGFDGKVIGSDVVTFLPKSVKFIAGSVDARTGRIASKASWMSRSLESANPEAFAVAKVKTTIDLKRLSATPTAYGRLLAHASQGELDPETLTTLAKMALADTEDAKRVRVVLAKSTDSLEAVAREQQWVGLTKPPSASVAMSRARETNDILIVVPRTITNPASQRKFVEEFVNTLRDLEPTARPGMGLAVRGVVKSEASPAAIQDAIAKTQAILAEPKGAAWVQEAWLKGTIEEKLKGTLVRAADGSYVVTMPGHGPVVAKRLEDAYAEARKFMLSDGSVTRELAMRGIRLTKTDTGYVARGAGLAKEETFADVAAVVDRFQLDAVKVSNLYAPPRITMSPTVATLEFDAKVLRGDAKDVLGILSKFEDPQELAKLGVPQGFKGAVIRTWSDGGVQVALPRYGTTLNFETMAEAKQALGKGVTDLKTLGEIAAKKGLKLEFDRKLFYVVNDGNRITTAADEASLATVLQAYPDPDGAPDLFQELDPAVSAEARELTKQLDPKLMAQWKSLRQDLATWNPKLYEVEPTEQIVGNVRDVLRSQTSSFDYWRDATLDKMGLKELKQHLIEFRRSIDAAAVDTHSTYEVIERILTPEGSSKLLVKDRRQALFYHMGAQDDTERLNALKQFGPLSADERRMETQIRNLLGRQDRTAVSGLARKYGISWDEFEQQYMSRIRVWAREHPAESMRLIEGSDVLNTVFAKSVPSKLRPWFEKERASELLNIARDDDILSVLMKYTAAGNRKLYVGTSWQTLDQ